MNFFNDHKKLFLTSFLFFAGLTILVSILPAAYNQNNNKVLPGVVPLSEDAAKGKHVYISNGCVACHTQQVRNIEMDKRWGSRPSIAADYASVTRSDFWRNTATLMGTERTGPDLTDIGNRQPGLEWHLVHLFNPRIVVKESIMPSYPWLFEVKLKADKDDIVINVPKEYLNGKTGKIVATKEARQLVAYLQSLKQTPLPDGTPLPEFLITKKKSKQDETIQSVELDGAALYMSHCQSCHQANGEGLPGAFPPLKGSPIINGDNLEVYVEIIVNGYDARPEFGVMPPVGKNAGLTSSEVAAIINHERSAWGNNSKKVTEEEIKKIIDYIKAKGN